MILLKTLASSYVTEIHIIQWSQQQSWQSH